MTHGFFVLRLAGVCLQHLGMPWVQLCPAHEISPFHINAVTPNEKNSIYHPFLVILYDIIGLPHYPVVASESCFFTVRLLTWSDPPSTFHWTPIETEQVWGWLLLYTIYIYIHIYIYIIYYIVILQSDDIRYIDAIIDMCYVHDLWWIWIWWITVLRSGGVLRTYHHFGQPHGYLHLWKAHGMSCSNPFRRNSAHPEIVQIVTKQAPFQQVQTATTSFLCLTRKVGKPSNPFKIMHFNAVQSLR